METAKGKVFKYGDNVDTDVIIPARYLNVSSGEELAKYCMIDIDADFVNNVKEGDIIVATKNFAVAPLVSMPLWQSNAQAFPASLRPPSPEFSTAMPSISACRFWNVRKPQMILMQAIPYLLISIQA